MSNKRVHELADQFDMHKQELVRTINELDLGFTVDNPFSALSPAEIRKLERAMGMEPLHDIWRLESLRSRSGDIMTGQTHLVVQPDQLWEVWPDSTYYEDEPGPEHSYSLSWVDGVGELTVHYDRRPDKCGLVELDDDGMRIRWGSVAGSFPSSPRDSAGSLAEFVREDDEAVRTRLESPPERVERKTRSHATLGQLSYDDDLTWWQGEVAFGGFDEDLEPRDASIQG
jgi:hypothetical protein